MRCTMVLGGAMILALTACAAKKEPGAMATPGTTASPAARAAAGRDCLSLANIRESKVVDDRTIDFVMRDGAVLRSNLPYACPSLGFERAFSYKTSLTQLCSTDIISVIVQGGGPRTGASCGLGPFTPIDAAAAAR